ncbi:MULTISPECIES: hypothetical protein [Stenotrophomonas]|uniref:hypothetical protein n=1 Tax=Stenotrophomonas TaxID=40323 RepID=UPI0028A932F3|nr:MULTISPECIES: hypothetical protein [Stenotrophomonas]
MNTSQMNAIAPTAVASAPVTLTAHSPALAAPAGRAPLDLIDIRNSPPIERQMARAATVARQIFPQLPRSDSADNEVLVSQLLKSAPPEQGDGTPVMPRVPPLQATLVQPSTSAQAVPSVSRPVSDVQRQRAERMAALIFGSTLDKRGFSTQGSGSAAGTTEMFHCLMRDQPTAIPSPGAGPAAQSGKRDCEGVSRIPRLQRPM